MTESNRSAARRSTIFAAGIAAAALLVAATPALAAPTAVKAGAACAKVGAKARVATTNFKCVKVGKKLVWQKVVIKTPADPIAALKAKINALKSPITSYPEEPMLPKSINMTGKKVVIVPIGAQIPVIAGIAKGLAQGITAAGGTSELCDGKFNPTSIASCLKTAGDQNVYAVVTMFIDYAMLPASYDALVKQGVKVLVAGVAPSAGKVADGNLAFYDPSARVGLAYSYLSDAAIAIGGTKANILWTKLEDSSLTRDASEAGVAEVAKACKTCKVATVSFTTANVDKLASAVSAGLISNPNTNVVVVPVDSFVPAAKQGIASAGYLNKVKIVSASGDLANMQFVKDGIQAIDFATPVLYEGWKYSNALFQLITGAPVLPQKDFVTRAFDSTNIGSLTLNADAYASSDWFGSNAYEAMFKKAWGIK